MLNGWLLGMYAEVDCINDAIGAYVFDGKVEAVYRHSGCTMYGVVLATSNIGITGQSQWLCI